ncbi:MAG: efflux RND transporter periplasmic adaptor subunit [Phycisphaerales bacterium]
MTPNPTSGAKPEPASSEQRQKAAPPPSPRPPRAMPWWLLAAFVVVAIVAAWFGTKFGGRIASAGRDVAARVTRSTADAGHDHTGAGGESGASAATQYYTCGMHPWVILPKPGDCPICHMKLTPLDPAKFTGQVSIDPVVVQSIGVRIDPVTEGPLTRAIRTVGTVEYDETRVRDVNTKVAGWIEKLHVDYVGAPVEQGQPLFEVYSPALFQAQEEYLLALRTQRPGSGDRSGPTLDLVESARTKLELLDITPQQIEALAKAGEPSRTMTVLSPFTGVVIAKHANEGMKIDPGMQVFRLADLSRVWVLVTLYESQLPYVSEGQRAVMSLPYIPGQTFEGKVVYIYPYLDTRTREVQVRLEFENPTGLLKPGMFATVELQSTLKREAVLVPRAAVMSTGERSVAFVSLGEGKFEPRQVRMGVETGGGQVEVLDGLKPGELVVTSGQFLLDSESRVREALAKMIRGDLASEQAAQVAVAGGSELTVLPRPLSDGLSDALRAYFTIGERLSSDSARDLAEPARALAAAFDRAIGVPIPGHEHFWHQHTEAAVARGKALEIATAKDLPSARELFADLGVALDKLLRSTGVPPSFDTSVQSLHCPMFHEGQGGAIWLQPAGPVRNPFFGSTMLECFDRREALPSTGASPAETPGPLERQPSPPGAQQSSPESRDAMAAVLDAYLAAQDQLTKDDAAGAGTSLGRIGQSLPALIALPGPAGNAAMQIRDALKSPGDDLDSLRSSFATISNALLVIAEVVPPSPRDVGIFHAYCPMVKEHWLQSGEEIRNPYDPGMLRCGSIKGRLDKEGGR